MASVPELSASTLVEVMTAMAGMPMPMTVRDCPLLVAAAHVGACAAGGDVVGGRQPTTIAERGVET